jgi:hypothetical protein
VQISILRLVKAASFATPKHFVSDEALNSPAMVAKGLVF